MTSAGAIFPNRMSLELVVSPGRARPSLNKFACKEEEKGGERKRIEKVEEIKKSNETLSSHFFAIVSLYDPFPFSAAYFLSM